MCCSSTENQVPVPPVVGDPLLDWEYAQPFKRIDFSAFKRAVIAAEASCGNQGYVTVSTLAEHLTFPSWVGLTDPESDITKFLHSPALQEE